MEVSSDNVTICIGSSIKASPSTLPHSVRYSESYENIVNIKINVFICAYACNSYVCTPFSKLLYLKWHYSSNTYAILDWKNFQLWKESLYSQVTRSCPTIFQVILWHQCPDCSPYMYILPWNESKYQVLTDQ
jgi:hypothetical protein